jgi:hypothetical protein
MLSKLVPHCRQRFPTERGHRFPRWRGSWEGGRGGRIAEHLLEASPMARVVVVGIGGASAAQQVLKAGLVDDVLSFPPSRLAKEP